MIEKIASMNEELTATKATEGGKGGKGKVDERFRNNDEDQRRA